MQENVISSSYEHALACVYHKIDNRGLLLDRKKLAALRVYVNNTINNSCNALTKILGFTCYLGADNDDGTPNSFNLNSSKKMPERLKQLGFIIPKIRVKNKDTNDYEFKESVRDLILQRILAEPSYWPTTLIHGQTAPDIIKNILTIREYNTIKNRYLNARLYNNIYYSCYNVAATVTGRRGSKKHTFGLGGNNQNFPKHSELGEVFQGCVTARPGKIFFKVDQISAEDWPVQALSENYTALEEMINGVNRHYKFASAIFGIPIDVIKAGRAKQPPDHQCEMFYYLGKKSRHANNYGMKENRMSESLAAEGFSYSKDACRVILEKVNQVDPNVQRVFHKYIQERIFDTRILVNPFGRERQFFGLRSNNPNYEILNEAYSWIPQSTIGDNTGLAVLRLDGYNDFTVHDGHDSICQEVPDNESNIREVFRAFYESFRRTITFHNGISVDIPIEGELCYNWGYTEKIKPFTEENVILAYKRLKERTKELKDAELVNVEDKKEDQTNVTSVEQLAG